MPSFGYGRANHTTTQAHGDNGRVHPSRALIIIMLLISFALMLALFMPTNHAKVGDLGGRVPKKRNSSKIMKVNNATPTDPIDRRSFGEYPFKNYADTFEELRKGMNSASHVLGSDGRHWTGGGVIGPSEDDIRSQLDKIFVVILSRLDTNKYPIYATDPNLCVIQHAHFALPPLKAGGNRKKNKKAAPAPGVDGFETLSSHFMQIAIKVMGEMGGIASPDCSITLPPLLIASCFMYAFSTLKGKDLTLFAANTKTTTTHSLFNLSRFKDSQCARFMTCGLWTSGEIHHSTSEAISVADILESNPQFAKAVTVLLEHFGAHVSNLREVDQLLANRKELFYTTRPSDVAPLLVTHKTAGILGRRPGEGISQKVNEEIHSLYVSFDPTSEKLAIGTSPKADPQTTVTFPQMSSEAVFQIFRLVSTSMSPNVPTNAFPKLIAFLGDSVERANYFALVSSLRRGEEYLRRSQQQGWEKFAAWSTSGMYDGRTLLVVFDDCDFLMSHFVYPFMNPDENGNGPMQQQLKEAIEKATEHIIKANKEAYASTKTLRYTTKDIIRSVLSPVRIGPSQVLQLGTLKWYLGLLRRLCEEDPTPTKELCPRLLLYFEFDMKADLPNIALLQQDGGEMFMDLWKTQTCRNKAIHNPHVRATNLPDGSKDNSHRVKWDESARSVVDLGLVMTSFGFWDHSEPVIISRLHSMFATDFGAMLAGSPTASPETLYLHRLSTLYHHQKGRDRPYYDAFREAFLNEDPATFNDISTVRQDIDADTRSSVWISMRKNFTFLSGSSANEELPGLWMAFTRKGKPVSPYQDTPLVPERRTREAVILPNRDKNIPPLRMMMQMEKMLVEGWGALLHLSKLTLYLTYNILQAQPAQPIPKILVAKRPISSNPVDQTQLLFDQYRYKGDAFGSVIGYSNAQRNDVLTAQSNELLKVCPIAHTDTTSLKNPPNIWAFDASMVQTLYPFTGTDIVHTDCHFNLNARRTERTRTSHGDGHVLMAEWGLTALFTSLHPWATDNGFDDGSIRSQSPTNTSKRGWSTIQPVCVDSSPIVERVTSVEMAVSLERRYFRLMFLNFGCEGNWTINTNYRANTTRPSLLNESEFPLAPPECSVLIGQTLHQCRNVLAESENYLRLLHILRAKSGPHI